MKQKQRRKTRDDEHLLEDIGMTYDPSYMDPYLGEEDSHDQEGVECIDDSIKKTRQQAVVAPTREKRTVPVPRRLGKRQKIPLPRCPSASRVLQLSRTRSGPSCPMPGWQLAHLLQQAKKQRRQRRGRTRWQGKTALYGEAVLVIGSFW